MIKTLIKKALKLFFILFILFVLLCAYTYYQMREHIKAFEQIQKEVNEANGTLLQKEYGTTNKDKVFNYLILEYLNNLERKDENATH